MSDPELTKLSDAIQTPGLIGLAFGLAAALIQQRGGLLVWLTGLLASVVVAILLGLGFRDSGVSIYTQWAIIGVCAYAAPDILGALGLVGAMVRTDPFGLVQKVRSAITGGKGGKNDDK